MKKLLLALGLLLIWSVAGASEQKGTTGFGVVGGSPTGVTAKHWLTEAVAIDGGIGYGNAAVFYADVLFSHWRLLPETKGGKTNLYAGLGPRIATDDGGQFAVRFMGGVAYWPESSPVELFAEVGPTLKLTPDNKVGLDGGIGIRYYFNLSVSPAR